MSEHADDADGRMLQAFERLPIVQDAGITSEYSLFRCMGKVCSVYNKRNKAGENEWQIPIRYLA